MRKTLRLLLLSLLLFNAACAPAPEDSASSTSPLRVGFTAWWGDYTLLVADGLGLFEKYGVEVELVYYENFDESLPALAAGQLDAGLLAVEDVLMVNKYTPLKVVGIYDSGGIDTIVASPSIQNIGGLKGKKVGIPYGSIYELMVQEMLRASGLSTEDVTIVNVPPEEVPENIANGNISAGYVYEPYTSQALAEGNKVLFNNADGTNLSFPDVIALREEVILTRTEEVQAFVNAWFDATEYRVKNPSAALDIVNKRLAEYGLKSNPEEAKTVLLFTRQQNLPYFLLESGIEISLERLLQLNADYLVRTGTLSTLPNIETIPDVQFLR